MASSPPFQVEDQTDEDFFDKLVDDDFGPSEAQASSSATEMKFDDGNDSDDARAFANLSIGDDSGGDDGLHEAKRGDDAMNGAIRGSLAVQADGEDDPSLVAPETVELVDSHVKNSKDEGLRSEMEEVRVSETAGETKIVDESGGSGVKEVGWSSFYADSSENGGHGFGSYSDFFSEFGENAGNFQGKVEENVTSGGQLVSWDTENKSVGLDSSVGFGQYQGDQVHGNSSYQSENGQDTNNARYWENHYPGWKYDANTGQWYQVGGHDASMNLQGSESNSTGGWGVVSGEKSDVVYLRQSTQSDVGTVAETGTTESVSSWNQVSPVNNGYPEHMVFDPQYPGWYYDTIAQEWRTLESYSAAVQSTGQAHDQQVQSGYAAIDSNSSIYGEFGQKHTHRTQDFGNQSQHGGWDPSYYDFNQQGNSWQSDTAAGVEATVTSASLSNFGGNQQVNNFYGTGALSQQPAIAQTFEKTSQGPFEANEVGVVKSFIPGTNLSQHIDAVSVQQNGPTSLSNDFYGGHKSVDFAQQSFQSNQQFSHAPAAGRSPDGRPPHALVTFGFGGKLLVIKENIGSLQNSSFGSQGTVGNSISIFNVAEVMTGNANASSIGGDTFGYFCCLYQQSFPGPLVGGNVGSKDLNKWLDERIRSCGSPDMDFSKGKLLRLLLSLLKISCQHYGKFRSPFGTDTTEKEMDTPEAAVAKLFASAKKNGIQSGAYGALSQCLQHLPSEAQMRVTASEVQSLLVSGRKMEALQCAQEGQLWGPALIIAAQLGDQFYVDTVKQMALRQLVPGSPLRTLCLLIAGQPAEVFSTGSTSDSSLPGYMNMSQHQSQFGTNSMLDDWEENLAIITANRTKDDELVITHLGDCLWKERSEIIAAHICYLVAEKNFEPYSDTARLCLVGADHWKYPRTYASPEAIQRTELYEYSKVLGNSQYILLPFQPYKLVYAQMLAEVGKVSDALKYCQALLKCLKTGRAPEVETWKQLVLSLEERIRIHQQGGYAANLAPAKLVGKLLNFFDSTAHRVVGGMPPPPPPPLAPGNMQVNEYRHQQAVPRVSTSQSTMIMSSLMPSASMEPIREWSVDGSQMTVQTRSVSEPDLGRRPRQDQVDSLKEKAAGGVAQEKSSDTATGSRFARFGFGSQFLKRTVGLVLRPRPSREAKLGEKNKFYYDEKLKRWVEEGAEPPAEEAALPPPPTTTVFQNNSSDFGNKSELTNERSPSSASSNFSSPTPPENSSGIPPIPSGSNQFSARGRVGVRARYVDTFNQGRGNSATKFQSPSVPSVKPSIPTNAKFFIPTTPANPTNEQGTETMVETTQEENSATENSSVPALTSEPFQTPTSSAMTMQRFPSLDNIKRTGSAASVNKALPPAHSRRTASWSGSFNSSFTPPGNKTAAKHSGDTSGMSPPTFMPSPLNSSSSFGDDLHEVEL